MIPSSAPAGAPAPKGQRFRLSRRGRRQAVIGAVVVAMLAITSVVIVVAVNGGSRAGTLTNGVGIDTFEPATGLTNEEVHLVGGGFTNATEVQFNGVPATSFNVVSDTEIVTLVPDGASKGPINVVTDEGTLTSSSDFVPAAPQVTSFTPQKAAAGSTLTITGVNLAGVTTVRINGKEATPTSATDTTVTVVVPNNATTGHVAVASAVTAIDSGIDISITSPAITSFDPAAAPGGTKITIAGQNLSGLSSVQFNGVAGTVVSVAPDGSSAVVTTPTNLSTGPVTLTTAGGSTTSDGDFVVGPSLTNGPAVTGAAGATITLNGINLTSVTAVGFPGLTPVSAGVTVVSDTQITVVVPPDAVTTGQFTVVGDGTTTGGPQFVPQPSITSFFPDTAPVGSSVTIYGRVLKGVTSVSFNGTVAPAAKVTDTSLSVIVPAGATSGALSVAVGAPGSAGYVSSSAADSFTVGAIPAPVVPYNRVGPGAVAFTPAAGMPATNTDFLNLMLTSSFTVQGMTIAGVVSVPVKRPGAGGAGTLPKKTVASYIAQFGATSKMSVNVTYQDPANWTVTPAAGAVLALSVGGAPVLINNFTGSVQAANGTIAWTLSGTLGAGALVANKFGFNSGATASLVNSCPINSAALCTGDGPWLRIDSDAGATGFAASVGNIVPDQTGLAYQAAANLGSGVFDLDATYPVGNPVTVVNGRLRIAYLDDKFAAVNDTITVDSGSVNGGLDIVFTGKSHVSIPYIGEFNPPSVTVRYVDGGSLAVFDFPMKRVLHEASLGSAAFLTGHGAALPARINGEVANLADGAWVFAGSMRMPTYMRKSFKIGDEGDIAVVCTMNTNGTTEIKAMFTTPMKIPEFAHIKTDFEGFSFALRFNESQPALKVEIAIGASGTIEFPGNAPMGVLLEGAIAITSDGPEVSLSLTGTGVNGRAAWPNVLGVNDFNLDTFSIQVGLSAEFPYLSVGLAGTGSLPGKLLEYIGAPDGVDQPANFIVNLSTSAPCLQVELGTPNNTSPILKLPKGTDALSVSYLKVSASLHGCTVGVFSVPAGVVIAEKATVLGVKQDVYAAFNPNPTGLPGMPKTPSFFGWVNDKTGADRGAIKFTLSIKWGAGGSNPLPYFKIDGLLKLGSNNAFEVHGACSLTGGCFAKGTGKLDPGIGATMDMAVDVEGIGTPLTSFTASGDLNLWGMKFALAGTFSSDIGAPLGFDFSASVDLPGKSALVDTLGIRMGYEITGTPAGCSGLTCTGWEQHPLFALTVSGNTGGVMKVINGAADAFGAPPAPGGGRYSLRAVWNPVWTNIHFGGSSDVDLGSLGTVGASLDFTMCLQPSCFGNFDLDMAFDYRTHGHTFTFHVPIHADWSFDYTGTYSTSFNESGQVGNSTLGLKGSISGDFSIGLRISSPPLSVSVPLTFHLKATAYLGLAGWQSLGSVKVSDNGSKFCISDKIAGKTYSVCV